MFVHRGLEFGCIVLSETRAIPASSAQLRETAELRSSIPLELSTTAAHGARIMGSTAKTVLQVLESATAYLAKHGIESPRLNAEHLAAHTLKKKRLDLYLEFDRPLGERELAPLRELVRKRADGIPLQHLLGTAEFHGRVFSVDARALVPRPETEQLAEMVLAELGPAARGAALEIADIGTGTGVLAITLAAELPAARVSAIDLSTDALALARQNAEALGLADRVCFLEGNLLESVEGPFDLIVANLPYIPTAVIATLQREVQRDPVMALDGGPDGLDLLFRLVCQAKSRLQPGGLLALEIGRDQSQRLLDKLAVEGYQEIRPAADYQGFQRFIFARYG